MRRAPLALLGVSAVISLGFLAQAGQADVIPLSVAIAA